MATTVGKVTVVKEGPMGQWKCVEALCDGPNSYDATNDHVITAEQLNLGRIHGYALCGHSITKSTLAPFVILVHYPAPPNNADSGQQGFGAIRFIWTDNILVPTARQAGSADLSGRQFHLIAWGDNGGAF